MRHSASLWTVPRSARQRALALAAGAVTLGTAAVTPLYAGASGYGRLVARRAASPSASLTTRFSHVRPPGSFLLVVTERTSATLTFQWELRCVSASHRESGGASGEATVSDGRWVKRVRANWIAHPAECTGAISGSAAASPVLVRVYAD